MTYDFPIEEDLMFLEVDLKEPDDLHLDFKIWNCNWGAKPYFIDSIASTPEYYDDRTKAAPYISGSIKWDGCINYLYTENWENTCMLHHCGIHDFEREFMVFKKLYSVAKELIKGNIIKEVK